MGLRSLQERISGSSRVPQVRAASLFESPGQSVRECRIKRIMFTGAGAFRRFGRIFRAGGGNKRGLAGEKSGLKRRYPRAFALRLLFGGEREFLKCSRRSLELRLSDIKRDFRPAFLRALLIDLPFSPRCRRLPLATGYLFWLHKSGILSRLCPPSPLDTEQCEKALRLIPTNARIRRNLP